ncbi:MAG TPA: extracellular solute-binding protein, partial [Chloroflexota bacterium]
MTARYAGREFALERGRYPAHGNSTRFSQSCVVWHRECFSGRGPDRGGETEALDYLYQDYKTLNPQVEVINSAMSGGTASGGNMKAVLQTRMLGGEPPESFQIHLGHELIDNHVVADRMEPLDDLYASEGWDKVFPKGLIDIASYQGHQWSVPVNIHRANVLWYNKKMFADVGVTEPPNTWAEFFAIGEKLKAKNQPLIGVAENAPGFWAHVTETILISTLGA